MSEIDFGVYSSLLCDYTILFEKIITFIKFQMYFFYSFILKWKFEKKKKTT